MDQDPERPPPANVGGAAGGNHDVTRHEALEQRRPAPLDVRDSDRYSDDPPSMDLGPVEAPLYQSLERRRPAPRPGDGLEPQDIHLPVALLPDQEAAGPVQTGHGVRTQEHLGQDLHQAARGRTRLSQRARISGRRRSRRSRTTP